MIENGEVYPIEIKKNYYPNKESTKHFHLAAMIGKIKNGLVICQAEEILPIPNSNNFLIPLRYL